MDGCPLDGEWAQERFVMRAMAWPETGPHGPYWLVEAKEAVLEMQEQVRKEERLRNHR
jgi:hypothetical protein